MRKFAPNPYVPFTPAEITGQGTQIYLAPENYDAAIKLGQAMDASVGNDYKNDPNGFGVSDRYLLGMLGEFAFATFLTNYGIRYDWSPQANGKSDNGDFILYYQGKPYTFDVKTLRGHRRKIMLSEREYNKKHINWKYVAVRQSQTGGRYFGIEGLCNYGDLIPETLTDGSKVWVCEIQNLKSIAFITTYCDKA